MIRTIITGAKILNALSGVPDSTQIEQKLVEDVAKSSIEYHLTGDAEKDKARINLFYDLPGGITSYSFAEFQKSGYFARMNFTKKVYEGITANADIKSGNLMKEQVGIGAGYQTVLGPVSAGIKVLPVWYDKTGRIANMSTVAVSLGTQIDLSDKVKLKLSAFGEANVLAKDKPQWGYGEANAQLSYQNFDFGIGYNLYNNNNIAPQPQFRIQVGIHPKL